MQIIERRITSRLLPQMPATRPTNHSTWAASGASDDALAGSGGFSIFMVASEFISSVLILFIYCFPCLPCSSIESTNIN